MGLRRSVLVAGAVLMVGVAGCADDSDDGEATPPSEVPETVDEGEPGDEAASVLEDEPETEPDPDPPAWEPGDPDDYLQLALGPTDGTGSIDTWADWLDCYGVEQQVEMAYSCGIPTEGGWATGLLFDWSLMFDRDDYEGVDDAQYSSIVLLGAETSLPGFVEAMCERGEVEVVYVSLLAPGFHLVFPYPDEGDPDPRRAAAAKVRAHLEDAVTAVELERELPHDDHVCPA